MENSELETLKIKYAALEAKLAECVDVIRYVMANNDKITGWDKLHDVFYRMKRPLCGAVKEKDFRGLK